LVQVWQR
jgi:hypothetical protein